MLPSAVAKCMTIDYYAIIYDHDHSKHINDHLRCRQHNGATCFICKVDFFAGNANHRMAPLLSPSTPTTTPPPPPTPPFTFEMQAVWVSHSAHLARLSFTLPGLTHTLSISLYLSLCESFTVPWHDQRQLCDTVRGIQEAENIKPLKGNLQNKTDTEGWIAHASVCMCVCE